MRWWRCCMLNNNLWVGNVQETRGRRTRPWCCCLKWWSGVGRKPRDHGPLKRAAPPIFECDWPGGVIRYDAIPTKLIFLLL